MARPIEIEISPARKYPGYWTIKSLRKKLRKLANSWLTRQKPKAAALTPIDPAAIRRVIICRRNGRLGNMLMLTPLVRSLSTAMPHAEIDLLIGSADYSGLFRGLSGVRTVWVMPSRGWRWPWRMLNILIKLRQQHYDLSIEPAINSFGNRLLAHLCDAHFALGFNTADQWLRLTHAVDPDPAIVHAALIPVQLVHKGINSTALMQSHLHITLTDPERAAGQARLCHALGDLKRPVVGFFTEATGKKRLPQAWWRTWANHLAAQLPNIQLVQILSPGNARGLDPAIPTLREPDHRLLAALLGQLDLFVSCDTGPMHLAGAAGTPTIGLFHASSHHRYRPLGKASLALEVTGLSPGSVAQVAAGHLRTMLPIIDLTPPPFSSRRTNRPQKQLPRSPQIAETGVSLHDN